MLLNCSESKPPLLPRLKDHERPRTLSSLAAQQVDQPRLSARPILTTAFSAGKLDQALDCVKKDIWDLWVRSKYVRELPGILTYSPTMNMRERTEVARSLRVSRKPLPQMLTVPSERISSREDRVRSKKSPSVVRVSSPSPDFPRRRKNRLRKVPSPKSFLIRKSAAVLQPFEILREEDAARLRAEVRKCKGTLADFERQNGRLVSQPSSPRTKVSVKRADGDRRKTGPNWNEKCLKVIKLEHKPKKDVE